MHRCLLFILALMLTATSVFAKSSGSLYLMNRERFVHLTPQQQKKIIIQTMQMMVEMESKFKKQVRTSGYSEESYKKFVQLFNQLQELLMSSAYAQTQEDAKTLARLAELFNKAQSDPSVQGDLCIYAGNLSRTISVNNKDLGRKVCTHPAMLGKGKYNSQIDQDLKNAYLASSDNCPGPGKISCNPVIFGYQTSATAKAFCVPTAGTSKSSLNHNVSSECMKLALSENPKDGADTADVRLEVLAKALQESSTTLNNVHNFIFDTCICAEVSNGIDSLYKSYIRPHRTCYGMMNTLREVDKSSCEKLETVQVPEEMTDQWLKFFSRKFVDFKIPAVSSPKDLEYAELIDLPEVQALCKSTTPDVVCEAQCKTAPDGKVGEEILCTVTSVTETTEQRGKKIPKKHENFDPKEYKVQAGSESFTVKKDDKEFQCPVKVDDGPGCSIAVTELADDPTKATLTVSFSGLPEKADPKPSWKVGETSSEASADDPKAITLSKTSEEQIVEVSFPLGKEAKTCSAAVPALEANTEEEGKFTIKASVDPKSYNVTAKTVKVLAELTPSEQPPGSTIVWRFEGEGASLLTEKPKAEVEDVGVLDGDGTEATTTSVDEPAASGSPILATLTPKKYKACARLISSDGTELAAESCADINALPAAPLVLPNPMQPPGPMPFLRIDHTIQGVL